MSQQVIIASDSTTDLGAELLERYQVKECYYGHLHGPSHRLAREGQFGAVDYHLVAADYIGFRPKKIRD